MTVSGGSDRPHRRQQIRTSPLLNPEALQRVGRLLPQSPGGARRTSAIDYYHQPLYLRPSFKHPHHPGGTDMSSSYIVSWHHCIFSTKDRQPLLAESILPQVYDCIGRILREEGGILLSAGGRPNHLHLLGSTPKQLSVPDTMRIVKSKSSCWIRRAIPGMENFAWQTGYGAFSVSHSDLDKVQRYLANQKEHHQTMTFQEEFLKFLDHYQVPYDERYIWR